MDNVILLSEYCNKHGIGQNRARRLARRDEFPGATKMLGVWAIDANAPVPTLPVAGTRGTSRTDGRKRYVVYLTDGERDDFVETFGHDNIIDPREKRRLRKLAETVSCDHCDTVAKHTNVIDIDNVDGGNLCDDHLAVFLETSRGFDDIDDMDE